MRFNPIIFYVFGLISLLVLGYLQLIIASEIHFRGVFILSLRLVSDRFHHLSSWRWIQNATKLFAHHKKKQAAFSWEKGEEVRSTGERDMDEIDTLVTRRTDNVLSFKYYLMLSAGNLMPVFTFDHISIQSIRSSWRFIMVYIPNLLSIDIAISFYSEAYCKYLASYVVCTWIASNSLWSKLLETQLSRIILFIRDENS